MDKETQLAIERAVASCPLKFWKEFFQKQREDQYETIRSAQPDKLAEIKTTIQVLDKIECHFKLMSENAKTKA